jgi:hypothetical protein
MSTPHRARGLMLGRNARADEDPLSFFQAAAQKVFIYPHDWVDSDIMRGIWCRRVRASRPSTMSTATCRP